MLKRIKQYLCKRLYGGHFWECHVETSPWEEWFECAYCKALSNGLRHTEWLRGNKTFLAAAHNVCRTFAEAADYTADQSIVFHKRLHSAIHKLVETEPDVL